MSWAEIVALLTIIGLVYAGSRNLAKGFITGIEKRISDPLSRQLARLTDSIDDLKHSSLVQHETFDKRLDKHDVKLGQHDIEIGVAYDALGLKRRRKEDE